MDVTSTLDVTSTIRHDVYVLYTYYYLFANNNKATYLSKSLKSSGLWLLKITSSAGRIKD